MAVYRFEAQVGHDRRLAVPPSVPEGPVDVVLVPKTAHPSQGESFREVVRRLAGGPQRRRSREELDDMLAQERAQWE